MSEDLYLIWSHEHSAWWRPGGRGYTQRISGAGRYTWDRALEICAEAMPGTSTRMGALPELPVRLVDVERMIEDYRAKFPSRAEPWE
jgi:hypothetical protein